MLVQGAILMFIISRSKNTQPNYQQGFRQMLQIEAEDI
jgi:hypothetical protein